MQNLLAQAKLHVYGGYRGHYDGTQPRFPFTVLFSQDHQVDSIPIMSTTTTFDDSHGAETMVSNQHVTIFATLPSYDQHFGDKLPINPTTPFDSSDASDGDSSGSGADGNPDDVTDPVASLLSDPLSDLKTVDNTVSGLLDFTVFSLPVGNGDISDSDGGDSSDSNCTDLVCLSILGVDKPEDIMLDSAAGISQMGDTAAQVPPVGTCPHGDISACVGLHHP